MIRFKTWTAVEILHQDTVVLIVLLVEHDLYIRIRQPQSAFCCHGRLFEGAPHVGLPRNWQDFVMYI